MAVEKKDFTYEMKFLLPKLCIEPALAWARANLIIDPHIHDAKSDCYRVTSIYFDTPALDTYRRTGSYGRSKYRVRRYASEESVFLERKMKTRGIVGKKRVRVPDEDLAKLLVTDVDPNWIGCWFHRRLMVRDLRPRCQISYERVARVGSSTTGPIRLTLDRNVRAHKLDQLGFVVPDGGTSLLDGDAILELKYQESLPAPFKQLADHLGVKSGAVSKYRLSIEAMGMAPKINGHVHPGAADASSVVDHGARNVAMPQADFGSAI